MDVSTNVGAISGQNQKAKMNPILKGGIIGGSIGGGIQGLIELGNCRQIKSLVKTTKDEFLKQAIDKCKGDNETINYVKKNVDSHYEEYLKNAKNALDKVKKGVPKRLLQVAGIVAGVGAAIGLIVHLVKSSKAKKEQAQ